MKILRRFNLVLLFLSLLFAFSFFSVYVKASDRKVENEGATYRVEKVVDQCDLGYGLSYSRNTAFTSVKSGHYTGKDGGSVGYPITAGKEYQQQVNVIEMLKDSEAQLIPYAYLSGGLWNTATVRNAALQFEQENPGKKVIAAVNGDWFQINHPQSASTGVTISNGEYYKNHTIHGAVNTLILDNKLESGQRIIQIGETAVKPMLAIYDEDGNIVKEFQINKVNSEPADGEIALYFAKKTAEFQLTTVEQKVTNAYIIERAAKAVTTIQESFYGKGTITSYASSFDLGLGNFAIKTNNSSADEFIKEGVTIRCQFEYANPALSNVENAIGFPYPVMKDGKAVYPEGAGYNSGYISDAKTRKPRTFLGVKEDGSLVFVNVDGRQSSNNMHGMTLMEMAATMQYYGCVNSWKFDGGGSATMIIRKQSGFTPAASFNEKVNNDWIVVNSPSDSSERSDGNCLLIVVDVPQLELNVEDITNEYVVFNVALLTELEKYTNLYVFIDGKGYIVKDGKVTIEGLKSNKQYECYVYGEYNGEYYNLGVRKLVKGALPIPTEVDISLSLIEKNGEEYIQVYFRVDNKQAIRSIDIEVNGKKYHTSSSNILLPKEYVSFETINDLEIQIRVVTSEYLPEQTIIFNNFVKEFNFNYAIEEIKISFDNLLNDIFS